MELWKKVNMNVELGVFCEWFEFDISWYG